MAASEGGRTKEQLSRSILQTANRLFQENGVEAVSMHQIAKCAGIGQGTLYRRYANKAELCMDVMQEQFDQFRCEVERYLSASLHLSVKSRISGVIDCLIDLLEYKSKWLGLIHAQRLAGNDKDDFYQSPPYHFLLQLFGDLLRSAQRDGLLRPIDPEFAAHCFISALSPYTYRHLIGAKGYTKEMLAARFMETTVDPLFLEEASRS